jgi:hypothetical protein
VRKLIGVLRSAAIRGVFGSLPGYALSHNIVAREI